jgi:hypothetical protein
MYILDTNILSELMDPEGASAVLVWADAVAPADQFTTAMSQAEVLYGLAVMPKGKRRTERIMWAEQMFAEDFPGRILPFEQRAAAITPTFSPAEEVWDAVSIRSMPRLRPLPVPPEWPW